jgi:acyl-CoA synthetase (AMP-forming)/AMP-acid ligase II
MHTALLLDMAADAAPDRLAVGRRASGLTYAQVAAHSRGAVAYLSAKGPGPIVFIGLNGPSLPTLIFAAGRAGRAFCPLNYRLANGDLQRLLARTAPSVAVVDDDMLGRVSGAPGVVLVARSAFEAACADGEPADLAAEEPDRDVAVLLFTSGTTGEPKAAVLRHANLTAFVISTVEFMGAAADEAALISVPPYHIAGISLVLTGMYSGRRLVHLPAFTPEAWVDTAVAEEITHAMMVPTMLGRVLDVLEKRGESLPRLKALSYGGGRMPLAVIERAMTLLPQADFVNGYGLTETSSTVAMLRPEDHRRARAAADPAARRRLGSVGRPLPSIELEVRGPTGERMPPGASGEIHVRGAQVAGEYVGRRMVDSEGWFATNDGGWLDEEGYLFVEGRLDDVIVRGGENISPGEIEDVLRGHPGVADVAVIGVPDDEWGERLAAVIVAREFTPTAEVLSALVKANLRSAKTPDFYEYRAELPYNETGKLLRRVLREDLARAAAAGRLLRPAHSDPGD